MSRNAIVRWQRIAGILNRARTPVSANRIADELAVSRRCVLRDLEIMRVRLEIPIVTGRRGHYLAQKIQCCAFCARKV